jgi:hypothetical protein
MNRSSRSSPSKSRSLVGSSSRSRSNRDRRIDARATRAASPPESSWAERSSPTESPRSAATVRARASKLSRQARETVQVRMRSARQPPALLRRAQLRPRAAPARPSSHLLVSRGPREAWPLDQRLGSVPDSQPSPTSAIARSSLHRAVPRRRARGATWTFPTRSGRRRRSAQRGRPRGRRPPGPSVLRSAS